MGNRSKLAVASLTAGILSFVQLFGIEKALMAIVFGSMALKEIALEQKAGRKIAYAAIILGSLYIVVLVVIAAIKGPQIFSALRGNMSH